MAFSSARSAVARFHLTAGTIFHRSRKPLRLRFKAIYLFVTQKTGISARGL